MQFAISCMPQRSSDCKMVTQWAKEAKELDCLDSHGHNAVLRDVPPGAKRCPGLGERLKAKK